MTNRRAKNTFRGFHENDKNSEEKHTTTTHRLTVGDTLTAAIDAYPIDVPVPRAPHRSASPCNVASADAHFRLRAAVCTHTRRHCYRAKLMMHLGRIDIYSIAYACLSSPRAMVTLCRVAVRRRSISVFSVVQRTGGCRRADEVFSRCRE